jgi:hypothetical protein
VQWKCDRLPKPAAAVLAVIVNAVLVERASAHVKWFCAYNVAGQPRGLENVLCADFELLVGLAVAVLLAGCIIERTWVGDAITRALDRVTKTVRDNTELLFRAGVGAFFVSLWTLGGILLTPELKTDWTFIPWLELGIAACMLSRRTMPLAGLGIAFLFFTAMQKYGAFHLADYPIFLGLGLYLALTGLQRDLFGVRPLDLLRWAASITLMWASIEKWAYPEWSFPLLTQHRAMTLGYDPEFFMRAAGVIEFTLAFALIWTPLVRRAAAAMLAGMFISAVFEFGKVDAIGHSAIIVALLAFAADNATLQDKVRHPLWIEARQPWFAPVGLCLAIVGFLAIYYVSHTLLFGTSIV